MVEESTKLKTSVRDAARVERQRKLAETLRSQADAEARGEDAERAKNWEWTVEENEEWEKKLARKARRADFEFHGTRYILVRTEIKMANNSSQTTCMLRGGNIRRMWIT